MKTSYFGRMNSNNFKNRKDLNWVSIARSAKYYSGRTYKPLMPTWDLINLEDEAEYEILYRDYLSTLDAQKVYDDLGEDAILLCHEKWDDIKSGEKFCHRRMVAEWLEEELGIEVPELEDVKQDLKKYLKKQKQISMFD